MFVTFEGIDGSGKSTQAALLAEALEREGREVVLTREPGGTETGEHIRELVLHGSAVAPWAEAALFAAARAQLVEEVVRPALARGAAVVCDRFLDSSLAYQGLARGLGLDAVLELNRVVLGGLLPDRTFLLLLPVEDARRRSTAPPDRIEREGAGFLERVDRAYRDLADAFPERIAALDATLPPATLATRIRDELRARA
jgi:dTMP kinase